MKKSLLVFIYLLILTVPMISLFLINVVLASPAYEDYTTFTESGSGDDGLIVVDSSTQVTFLLPWYKDRKLYKDYGTSYFGSSFTHFVDITPYAGGDSGDWESFWAVTNTISHRDGLSACLYLGLFDWTSYGYRRMFLSSGGGIQSTKDYLSSGTTYYMKITRYGSSLQAKAYGSASNRLTDTSPLFTLSVTIASQSNVNYRYLWAVFPLGGNSGGGTPGHVVRNLDLRVEARTIIVPDEYPTIRAAINAASWGDTIFVKAGTYSEGQITIGKPLQLIGENKNTTIIDGGGSWVCVYVNYTRDVSISGFTVQNGYGIYSWGSENVTIIGNIISNNPQSIVVGSSTNVVICRNIITLGGAMSIFLTSSNGAKIYENVVASNGGDAIWLDNSHGNIIGGNNVSYNDCGIRLDFSSSDNIIYHNNIVGNDEQATIWMAGNNAWDDGYPSGGNYWSDYEEKYPNATELDSSGIWDTSYVIGSNNRDWYPLMKPYPWGQHDIGITGAVLSKDVVGWGFSVYVNAVVFNYGNDTETFNVTIYANSTVVDTFTNVTVSGENSTTVSFTWNTTGFAKGYYSVNVCATPLPGELHTIDNTCRYWVLVTVVGDVDGDRDVDVGDQRKVQMAMFSTPGDTNWEPNMDIDSDLDVDVGDQRKQQLHMFESW